MRSHRHANHIGLRVAAIVLAAVGGIGGGAIVGFFRANANNADTPLASPQSNTAAPTAKVLPRNTTAQNNATAPANSAANATSSTNITTSTNQTNPGQTDTSTPLPPSAMVEVPAQNQLPQLPNGCEVTSLSMLLSAVGHPVSRYTLEKEIAKDPTPLIKDSSGKIVEWGNPNVGFVGDMATVGYGVYHGPVAALINQILPNRAVDLTGQPFDAILRTVAAGTPVEVWTNQYFVPLPESKFITWQSPTGTVRATFFEHAVLLVGYDDDHIYIDNPLGGVQDQAVNRQSFIESWAQMDSQAVTVAKAAANAGAESTTQ